MRPQHPEHTARSGLPGTHTRRRILHHHTLLRPETKQFRPTPVRLWIRLAPFHHFGTDNAFRHRQSGSLQPCQQQPARRRGPNRPTLHREALHHHLPPRQHLQIRHILHLHVLDRPQTLLRIDIRPQHLHQVDRAHPMRYHKLLRVRHSIPLRPASPAAHSRFDGADQHPIHIEQDAFRSHANRPAQPALPCSTNACAAASTFATDSTEQLSQYTRSSGSVPDARNSNHVSAAFFLPAQSGLSRKNLMPSSVSTRSTFIPAKSAAPAPPFIAPALAIADCFTASSICISTRPYWCSPNSSCSAATNWPSVFFSSAITLASSRQFSNPSRSGRCRLIPTPPDSSPPIKISFSSIRSTT